jgi:peptide methionine sulfoxide reductase msrA/msrB
VEVIIMRTIFILLSTILLSLISCTDSRSQEKDVKYNKLTPDEEKVILHKGTERPFTGIYNSHKAKGTYLCKRCDAPLYRSKDKFDSGCGWPSFDDEMPGAVKRIPDKDGVRTEIVCANCGGHLGHVFLGEGLTHKNVRHCVNSISLSFTPANEEVRADAEGQANNEEDRADAEEQASVEDRVDATHPANEPAGAADKDKVSNTQTAYFAGGCFWGVEYFFQKAEGVVSTRVGYMGGHTEDPTYRNVCSGTSGHAEALEVVFDPAQTSFEKLARLFFETHDPTQVNRQGPDIGEQYRSAIFYVDDEQKKTAQKLVELLEARGYKVATELSKAGTFWEAEAYHQDYYFNNGKQPYCHAYTERF